MPARVRRIRDPGKRLMAEVVYLMHRLERMMEEGRRDRRRRSRP